MPVNKKNEPQLSEEMEKRLEKFLTDTWGWSYEYGEWLDSESQPIGGIKDLKHFLATAPEEQRQEYVRKVDELATKWDGSGNPNVQIALYDVLAILNGKEA